MWNRDSERNRRTEFEREHSRSILKYRKNRALTSRHEIKLPDTFTIYDYLFAGKYIVPRDVRYRQSFKNYFHNIYLKCLLSPRYYIIVPLSVCFR